MFALLVACNDWRTESGPAMTRQTYFKRYRMELDLRLPRPRAALPENLSVIRVSSSGEERSIFLCTSGAPLSGGGALALYLGFW